MKGNARVDVGLFLIRLGLGLVFLHSGSQKMFGVSGGLGYVGTVEMFTKQGIWPIFANLAIMAEFFGGLGVLVGFITPVAALGITCTMATATYFTVSASGGPKALFTPNFDLSHVYFPAFLCLASLALLIMGPGGYSFDAKYFRSSGGGRKGRRR